MLPYGLLSAGRWSEAQVELLWVPEPERSAAWHAQVEARWQELKREEPSLHDAGLAGLRGQMHVGERISLTLAHTTYRITAATHRHFAETLREHGVAGLGMGIACAVGLVLEDALFFGRRSQRVFGGRGQWHPPAGHWEPEAHRDALGRASPFAATRVEMHEELGLEAHELTGLSLIGVQLNPDTQKPELHFSARVPLTRDELKARQAAARDAHEIDALLFLERHQIAGFLNGDHGRPTEIARACAYLHETLGLLALPAPPL